MQTILRRGKLGKTESDFPSQSCDHFMLDRLSEAFWLCFLHVFAIEPCNFLHVLSEYLQAICRFRMFFGCGIDLFPFRLFYLRYPPAISPLVFMISGEISVRPFFSGRSILKTCLFLGYIMCIYKYSYMCKVYVYIYMYS